MTFGRTTSRNQHCYRRIYLNISISISKIHSPRPSRAPLYIAWLPLEKLPQDIYFNAESFVKLIMICENNYSRENNYNNNNMPQILNMPPLNIAGFWLYQSCKYARVLNMILVLNMSGFWIYHSFKYVSVTQRSKYT